MTHDQRTERRSNSDWTDDLPPAECCSIVNRESVKYTDFSWQIEANQIQITGFFTHRNNRDKSEIRQRIAQRCFGDEVEKNSTPGQVMQFLGDLTEELRTSRCIPREAWNSAGQNHPMQIGIILQHNQNIYTSSLGCQSIIYPVMENIKFSIEVEVSGPHAINGQGGKESETL